jgi:hypothetical protein
MPLLVHVPVTSCAYAALNDAVRINGLYDAVAFLVDCSETDSAIYLATAQKHLPRQVEELKIAIIQAVETIQD